MLIWFVSAWVTKQRWATKQQSLFLKLQAWLRRLEICRNRYFAPYPIYKVFQKFVHFLYDPISYCECLRFSLSRPRCYI